MRRRTAPITSVIAKRRLCLFGHLARAEPTHHKITRASFEQSSFVLQRIGDAGQVDQGGHGFARTIQIELDLQPHNIGLNTAWMRAQDRSKWRQLVETAMLTDGLATRSMMMMN